MASERIEETISYQLVEVVRAYRNVVGEVFRDLHLYPGQEQTLAQLWKGEGLSPTELASACGLEAPTVTKVLERMSRSDLIRVEGDPDDRRVRRIYLTKRGRLLKGAVCSRWSSAERKLLGGFSESEQASLRSYLSRMRENIAPVKATAPRRGRRNT